MDKSSTKYFIALIAIVGLSIFYLTTDNEPYTIDNTPALLNGENLLQETPPVTKSAPIPPSSDTASASTTSTSPEISSFLGLEEESQGISDLENLLN